MGSLAITEPRPAKPVEEDGLGRENLRYLEEIRRLIQEGYYGKVTLSLERGRILFLRKEQTIKF